MQWFASKNRSTPDDLSEEMQQHLEEKIEALMESGLNRKQATAQANRAFGNRAILQESSYAVWRGRYISPIADDIRFAWRQLKHSPVFAIAAILILGLGIAANTSVFTVIYAITQRELPVYRPAELATMGLAFPNLPLAANIASFPAPNIATYPIYEQLAQRQQSFTGIAAVTMRQITLLDAYGDLRTKNASLVSGNFFDQLGVRPALGRMLTDADDVHSDSQAPWPVVLSYSFWKENFRKDRSILGKTITISQGSAVVVGVTAPPFDGLVLGSASQVFIPVHFLAEHNDTRSADPLHDPALGQFLLFGRLKPGVSLEEADREINSYTESIAPQEIIKRIFPNRPQPDASLHVSSGRRFTFTMFRGFTGPLTSLQVVMAIVLFLCCFNVTGLQLARVAARRHEFAVRIALGAARGHLIRQSLVEASILSLGGVALAIPIAWAATSILSSFLTRPGEAVAYFISPDWSVLAIAGTIAALVTLIIGTLPALAAGKTMPGAVLRAKTSLQRRPMFAGRILVPLQTALSFLLVVVTGLLLTTLVHLREQDNGYEIDHVVEAYTQLWRMNIGPDAILDHYRQIVHQLRSEPGMENAGMTWITPMMGALASASVQLSSSSSPIQMDFNMVGPGYFDTLHIARLSGREFDDYDTQRSVCIVNRAAEQVLYRGRPALDGNVMVSSRDPLFDTMCRIIGVVNDTRYADLRSPEKPTIYLPITTESLLWGGLYRSMVILMRAQSDAAADQAYHRVMAKLAPGAPLAVVFPLRAQKNEALGVENLITLMCVLFGGLALPLSGAGMFGLLAVRVEQLTPEIVLRLVFGASRLRVLGQILRESLLLLAIGLLAGVPLLLATCVLSLAAMDRIFHIPASDFVSDFVQHFLHATTRLDIYNTLGAVVLLTLVALVAGLFPGWRASRLDPLSVLRRE